MIKVHLVGGALLNAVGVGASNASGPLCVCRSLEDVAAKFRPGDVLVVPYTTNDLLPYIRQAAAVISEESGTNGHAATVGLTLGKAVIVGAARRRPAPEGRCHGLCGLCPRRGPDAAPVNAPKAPPAKAGGAFSLHRRPAEPEWKRALWGTIPRQGILIP